MSYARLMAAWLALMLCAGTWAQEPSVRIAQEDWTTARELTHRAPWTGWLTTEMKRVDQWMQVQRDDTTWTAGWAHDFIDSATGAFIPWTPTTDCRRYGAVNTRMFSACLMMQRTRNIEEALNAARLGTLKDDDRYRTWAAAQLDTYRAIYQAGRRADGGALFVDLLAEATATFALANSVRLLRPKVSADQAEGWCQDLLRPMANAMLQARRNASNITVWYDSAAAIVAMTCGDASLQQAALKERPFGLWAVLDTGLSSDGFWYELSPQYQAYVASALTQLLIHASVTEQASHVQPLWPLLRKMLLASAAMGMGGGESPILNDMNKTVRAPNDDTLREALRVLPSRQGIEATRNDWTALLDPVTARTTDLDVAVPGGSAWVEGARTLMLRSNGWFGALRGGQLAPFHVHQDTLSIELKHGSTWLFRNSVTPGYGSELQRNFYKLAAAVSTPMVDGNGTSNWLRPLASWSVETSQVSAKLTSFAKDVTVDRTLSVEPTGNLRDTVTFSTGAAPRVFSQLYHSDCVLPEFPVRNAARTVQRVSRYLLNWEALAEGTSEWTTKMDCNGETFVTTVTASRPFAVWRANGPALGPARRRMALLVELEPGGTGSITVTHQPSEAARATAQHTVMP